MSAEVIIICKVEVGVRKVSAPRAECAFILLLCMSGKKGNYGFWVALEDSILGYHDRLHFSCLQLRSLLHPILEL